MPVTGLKNILGSRNVEQLTCNVTETIQVSNGPDNVTNFTGLATIDNASGSLTLEGFPVLFSQAASSNFDGSLGSLCGLNFQVGLSRFSSTFGEIVTSGTGIYEFIPMAVSFAGAAILASLILAGISFSKKLARQFTEETSEDDAIEYYEDSQGRERWRIKASVRNRMDN